MGFSELLTQSVTISRPSAASGQVGFQVTYTSTYTGVRCRISPVSARISAGIFGRVPASSHEGFVEGGTDVQENDRLIVSSTEYYRVDGVENYNAFGFHKRLWLTKMAGIP